MLGRSRAFLAAATLGTLLAMAAAAAADATPLEKASAESLFQDAMKLMADKQYAAACPKLEESERLDPGMGTQFRLAECYEAVGRTASAWGMYAEVADFAKASGQADRERVARERAANVESKLARLTVTVNGPDVAGLEIRRGGVLLGKAQWGSAVPVDPGRYEVTATAPGKLAWTGAVTVDREGSAVTLNVPALNDAPPVLVIEPPLAPQGPHPRPRLETHGSWTQRKTLAVATGVVGIAGLGIGSAFGIETISAWSSSRSLCSPSACASAANHMQAVSDQQTASSSGVVSTVAFGLGAAAFVGAVVLWLGAPSGASEVTAEKEATLRLLPSLGAGSGGLVAVGGF